jgi:hypothetical protein
MSSTQIPGVTDLKDSNFDAFQAMFHANEDPSNPANARRKKKWHSRAWKAVRKAAQDVVKVVKKAICWYEKNTCKCIRPGEECPEFYTCIPCYSEECQYPSSIKDKCKICNNRNSCAAGQGGRPTSSPYRRQGSDTSNATGLGAEASNATTADPSTIFTGPDPWSLLIGQPLVPRSTRFSPSSP